MFTGLCNDPKISSSYMQFKKTSEIMREQANYLLLITLCFLLLFCSIPSLFGSISGENPFAGCQKPKNNSPESDKNQQMVNEFLTAVNTGSRNNMHEFVLKFYDPGLLKKVPASVITTYCMGIYYESGGMGYKINHAAQEESGRIVAEIYNKFTGARLKLTVPVSGTGKLTGLFEAKILPGYNPTGSAEEIPEKELTEKLKTCIRLMQKDDEFSGIVLVAKGEKILLNENIGFANRSFEIPVNENTLFNLASVGKVFTGTAVVQLAEQGKLSFDDTLDKYLDAGWLNPEISKKIKIKHLLTHTSGLGDYFSDISRQWEIPWFREMEDYRPLVSDDTLLFEPGTRFSYSNTGMLLLGVVIENASGENYFDFLKKHLFNPCGMIRTDGYSKEHAVKNRAVGYTKVDAGNAVVWNNNRTSRILKGTPSGGIYSTAADLLKFSLAINSGKILSAESMQFLTEGHPELNASFHSYGFFVANSGSSRELSHSGDGGGVNCVFKIYPVSGYTLIILSNYNRPAANTIANTWNQLYQF